MVMVSLKQRIDEKYSDADEEIQQYIDIISMNPKAYQKYIDILKTKYGVDYHDLDNDQKHIDSASLKDIKEKGDFLNYDNYIKYSREIYKLRKLIEPNHINKTLDSKSVEELGKLLGFNVQTKEYSGTGNYASFGHGNNTITTPKIVDVNTLIHEIGHWFDVTYKKGYLGFAKKMTHTSTAYGLMNSGETFADNFMHYFIAPKFLKRNLPEVFSELDTHIPQKIKKVIGGLI